MAFFVPETSSGSERELIPAMPHLAVCCGIADLGSKEKTFKGETKWKRVINIQFELAGLRDKGDYEGVAFDRPRYAGMKHNLDMSPKSWLRRDICAWIGRQLSDAEAKAFDIDQLIGKPCILSFQHSDCGKWSNIAGIMPIMAGQVAPRLEAIPYSYSIERDGLNFPAGLDAPQASWVKTAVLESPEGAKMAKLQPAAAAPAEEAQAGIDNPAIPF